MFWGLWLIIRKNLRRFTVVILECTTPSALFGDFSVEEKGSHPQIVDTGLVIVLHHVHSSARTTPI